MSDTRSPYGDDVVDPYSADDTKNPHEPAGDGAADAGDDQAEGEETPKRRPGRPKKTVE